MIVREQHRCQISQSRTNWQTVLALQAAEKRGRKSLVLRVLRFSLVPLGGKNPQVRGVVDRGHLKTLGCQD